MEWCHCENLQSVSVQIRGNPKVNAFKFVDCHARLFACDEQAFFKSACDDEMAFCPFLIRNFKALRLEI